MNEDAEIAEWVVGQYDAIVEVAEVAEDRGVPESGHARVDVALVLQVCLVLFYGELEDRGCREKVDLAGLAGADDKEMREVFDWDVRKALKRCGRGPKRRGGAWG